MRLEAILHHRRCCFFVRDSLKDIEVCFVKGDAFVSFCGLLLSGEANHVLPQCAAVYTAERSFSFEVVG